MQNTVLNPFTGQILTRRKDVQRPRKTAFWIAAIAAIILLFGCGGGSNESAPTTTMKTYLPTITINTTNAQAITSKDVYVTGTYKTAGLDGATVHEGTLEIKGRGLPHG